MPGSGSSPNLALGFWGRVATRINRRFGALIDRPIPQELLEDPEMARRAGLITRFGVLGSLFGFSYAAFYLFIGHVWGTVVILICSSGVAATPFLMRWKKSVQAAGNFLALTLTWGFTALCFVEGGLHGHAIAWLVSVPLCALLLVGQRWAGRWAVIAFFAASVVAGVDLAGVQLPLAYDPKWNSIVSSAGYLGLIIFMFILGLIFEAGRGRAFAKMQDALGELAATNERLLHLNNEKNEFLGIAAHDLKNPLTVVVGSADLLKMAGATGDTKKLAETIASAAKRMSDLINNLLDANAIEQGKFTSNIERCDLDALVKQSVENNQPAASRKNINLRIGTSPELWATADRAATLQILDNLISNALKYSPPNTTVHIHTLPEQNHVLVKIRDEGPGISEADQRKLFQKFSRLSARPTGGESSTGLGLSIVKRLAEAMGGTVQCHSSLGAGATFILRLPTWIREVAAQSPPPAPGFRVPLPKAATQSMPQYSARN
jgi:signal transduction histidine kinase